MFGTMIDEVQAQSLIERVLMCKFPFQCAHGRPSFAPIIVLGGKHVTHPATVNWQKWRKVEG